MEDAHRALNLPEDLSSATMAVLSSKILMFISFLCVYIYGIKGRPNNLEDVTSAENQNNFEETNLLKRSKTKSGGQDKGMT